MVASDPHTKGELTSENRSTPKLWFPTDNRESEIPQKHYRPKEISAKLKEAEVLLGQGKKASEAAKAIGVSEVRW
ncbi:MAG: hypothetical protein ABSC51_06550 [Gaiellaceae bacterium]|jgi:hypothetical protein